MKWLLIAAILIGVLLWFRQRQSIFRMPRGHVLELGMFALAVLSALLLIYVVGRLF